MAASLNKVLLIGNLTRDPELRYVPSGTAVANFDLAVNRTYNTQSGEKKEDTCFVKIIVWARRAEVCAEYLSKGSPVFVEGRLRTRSWEGQDGQKRNVMEVVANNVQFLRGAQKTNRSAPPENKDIPMNIPEDGLESIDLNESKTQDDIPF